MHRLPGIYILALTLTALMLAACGRTTDRTVDDPKTSVYYWRTTLRLDSAERQFIARHHVERIYMRFFDVVPRDGRPMPNATIKVLDSVPEGVEVVPTVFITENCIALGIDSVAQLLVSRVVQIAETNDLPEPRELQIDCDWTARSQKAYFAFLQTVRDILHQRGMRLSATIRLHQLNMDPPPVDYGVLMVYNTGNVRNANRHNPILDIRDVQPYVKYASRYDLPLCAAYPVFSWPLLYRGSEFKGVLRGESMNDTSLYRNLGDGKYLVRRTLDLPAFNDDGSETTWVTVGDTVVVYRPTAREIFAVMETLERQRPGINKQTVIYSLDTKNINNYNTDDYEKILRP